MNMHTGAKIRGIRLLKNLSQENMAEMLDMSILAYGNIERGKTNVSEERLQQIADKLGVSTDDILGFSDKVNNFFDHCNGNFVNTGGSPTNNYNLAKEELEVEKLKLEIEKLKLEKEKAELEAKYWREKSDKL
ncbi:helix-turn-helix domain-containing protein [Emticicia agri]|uniref:XRE family transcriptional regulator n=1 Tax=Emticicia agri TaxID=2492393 RepID=A0A4Q5LTR6_9BACT|nr:helix-turn-helix transcriptional regulator [Emticicia agri]RYU93028.1 XRE family transcriptional regulator [Emticicia agri]